MLKKLLDVKGATRKEVCYALGISAPAFTQYLKGNARPSFEKLILLAEFFEVNLDYLVFGDSQEANPVDYGPLAHYIDTSLSQLQQKNSNHTAMLARLTQSLSSQINETAQNIANSFKNTTISGFLQTQETIAVESYSLETCIVSLNLDDDMIHLNKTATTATKFLPIVAQNISRGRSYRFILPKNKRNWKTVVRDYLYMLKQQCQSDIVFEKCQFRSSQVSVVAGYALYHLDTDNMKTKEPALLELVASSVDCDRRLGYMITPCVGKEYSVLMDIQHLTNAKKMFEELWGNATPVK